MQSTSESSIVIDYYRFQSISIGDRYRLISMVLIDFRNRFLSIAYAWYHVMFLVRFFGFSELALVKD